MEGSFIFLKIGRRETVTHDHVGLMEKHPIRHLPGALRRVCVIAVHHDVTLGIDLPEHAADHVALALSVLMPDDGARSFGDGGRIILRVVVIDIDYRFRQHSPEITYDLLNCFCFIVARYENRNSFHVFTSARESYFHHVPVPQS